MKRFSIILAFLVFCGFSLYAQSGGGISIYVDAITGPGAIPENDAYYRNLLTREVQARHYRLVGNADTADYTLKAMIGGPYAHNAVPQSFAGYNEPHQSSIIYLFHLVLEAGNEHSFVAEQNLLFDSIDTLREFLPEMMNHAFSLMPAGTYVPPPAEIAEQETEEPQKVSFFSVPPEWRDKWLFVGLNGLVGFTTFKDDQPKAQVLSYGGGIITEFLFMDFLSLETGVNVIYNGGLIDSGKLLDKLTMEVPVLIRLTMNPPSHKFVFGPFGGIRLSMAIPVLQPTPLLEPSFLSWVGGFHYEGKVGPGALFAAPSISGNLSDFKLNGTSYTAGLTLRISIGYKIGFFPKMRYTEDPSTTE